MTPDSIQARVMAEIIRDGFREGLSDAEIIARLYANRFNTPEVIEGFYEASHPAPEGILHAA